jgi:hypothetical protein
MHLIELFEPPPCRDTKGKIRELGGPRIVHMQIAAGTKWPP